MVLQAFDPSVPHATMAAYGFHDAREGVVMVWKLPKITLGRRQEHLEETVPYDPELQYPVIRASICTGERVAGFKNRRDGHFTEVMLIRSPEDERRFMEAYQIERLETEY